jgi:hypothetical protein
MYSSDILQVPVLVDVPFQREDQPISHFAQHTPPQNAPAKGIISLLTTQCQTSPTPDHMDPSRNHPSAELQLARMIQKMTLPPTPVELILSARAAKSLRVRQLAPASDNPAHFVTQWRVELCKDWANRNQFLVTNLSTLYTFLIPRTPRQTRVQREQEFRMRLGFALLAGKPMVEWRPDSLLYVRAAPRKVIGSMNDMVYHLQFEPIESFDEEFPDRDAADLLNHTPFSAIGSKNNFERPHDAWLAALANLADS